MKAKFAGVLLWLSPATNISFIFCCTLDLNVVFLHPSPFVYDTFCFYNILLVKKTRNDLKGYSCHFLISTQLHYPANVTFTKK